MHEVPRHAGSFRPYLGQESEAPNTASQDKSHYSVPDYRRRDYSTRNVNSKYLAELISEKLPLGFDLVVGADPNGEVYGFMRPPINGNRGVVYIDGNIGDGPATGGGQTGPTPELVAEHELAHVRQLSYGQLGYDLHTIESGAEREALNAVAYSSF